MDRRSDKLDTGIDTLNEFLGRGYDKGIITTIYGPGGSGKTNLAMFCMISVVRSGKKAIYIHDRGNFPVQRLMQLEKDYKELLDNVLLFRITSFDEQINIFRRLRNMIDDKIGIIIVDSFTALYRLCLADKKDIGKINKELINQIDCVAEVARKKDIPALLTTEVTSKMDGFDNVRMIGGDIMNYSSKCVIELEKLHDGRRKVILRKHRTLQKDSECLIEIRK